MGDDAITAYHEQVNHPLFRKMKTSDFFYANIRTFDTKHPYFLSKKSDVLQLPDRASLLPLQKKFLKISYISYTCTPDILYLLAISGEVLGVG